MATDYATASHALGQMTQQRSSLQRERDSLLEKIDAARKAETNVLTVLQSQTSTLKEQLSDEQHAVVMLKEKHAGITTRFNERIAQIETMGGQVKDLPARLDQAIESRDAALGQLEDLRQEQAQLKAQIGAAKAALTA